MGVVGVVVGVVGVMVGVVGVVVGVVGIVVGVVGVVMVVGGGGDAGKMSVGVVTVGLGFTIGIVSNWVVETADEKSKWFS